MKGDPLPPEDSVVRYCKPSTVDEGEPTAASFALRDGESYLSVYWQEFHSDEIQTAINAIRAEIPLTLGINGRFAVVPVGATIDDAKQCLATEISILHWPEQPDGTDPSHSGIFEIVEISDDLATLIISSLDSESIYPATE